MTKRLPDVAATLLSLLPLLIAAPVAADTHTQSTLTRALADSLYAALGAPIPATTCTNQFVSAIATSGAGTCTTVTLAGAQFANQGTTTTVYHGNASGNGSFGQVAIGTEVSGLGTGVATFLATPSSANFRLALSDENGTGAALFDGAISPAFTTPSITGNVTFVTGDTYLLHSSSIALRNSVSNNRGVLRVMPNGTVANVPAGFEFFGTDFFLDAGNYERLIIYAKGSGDTNYIIGTDAGGTGTVRPLMLRAGASNSNLLLNTDGTSVFGAALSITGGVTLGASLNVIYSARAAATFQHGAADAASPVAQTVAFQGSRGGTDTNVAGADATIQGSLGTGTAAPKAVNVTAAAQGTASGTTQHTAVLRQGLNWFKSLSNNTATTVANVTDASDTGAAVIVRYAVEVNDGASHHQQIEVGQVSCSVINTNGTFSGNTCTKYGNQQSISASGGTLTVTWTITAANPALLQINSNTGTITPSLTRVTYSIENLTQQAVTEQ